MRRLAVIVERLATIVAAATFLALWLAEEERAAAIVFAGIVLGFCLREIDFRVYRWAARRRHRREMDRYRRMLRSGELL